MTTTPTPASQPSPEVCTGCWKRVEECRCASAEQPSPARSGTITVEVTQAFLNGTAEPARSDMLEAGCRFISDSDFSKAVRAEIKRRFERATREKEGAVALTYSSDAIKTAQTAQLSVSECVAWFIERSEKDYAK